MLNMFYELASFTPGQVIAAAAAAGQAVGSR